MTIFTMNRCKTVFAPFMSMMPEYDFDKYIARYNRNHRVRNFTCRDHFYVICFAQRTQRDCLRDIEHCLKAVFNKLYHCGISPDYPRFTLTKANELRNWRIGTDFTRVFVDIASPMYQNDHNFRIDTDNLFCAFDSSTISLCLKRCPWATFRENKYGIKSLTKVPVDDSPNLFINNHFLLGH